MTSLSQSDALALLEKQLEERGILKFKVDVREYPEETIFVVRARGVDLEAAVEIANAFDSELSSHGFSGFVTVRRDEADHPAADQCEGKRRGVSDKSAADFADLLAARSRSSESQPSLSYIPDAADYLSAIVTSRNHLVFGRRGAGKTTLMVEAKRRLEARGALIVWINIQTYRHEGPYRTFAWVAASLLERLQVAFAGRQPRVLAELATLRESVESVLAQEKVAEAQTQRLMPRLRRIIERALSAAGVELFVFLDDLHYLNQNDQPLVLDMLHSILRDLNGWLKVASIRHLSKWWDTGRHIGLQSGHDADHIDLDLTLEEPTESKRFLDAMLNSFAMSLGLNSARNIFAADALNRLVLASGAVPRDYLVLAAAAIRQARKRANALSAGVQDVNRAAGDHSKVKLAELEDDAAASSTDGTRQILAALNRVRTFCLDEARFSYFRIDFRDKERHPQEYALTQGLLDVRILHLVSSSLSDAREAGRRFEVFMLDLSQFSGQRFKKNLSVLDFVDDHIVLKKTSTTEPHRVGDTARKLTGLLRRGPEFELSELSAVLRVGGTP